MQSHAVTVTAPSNISVGWGAWSESSNAWNMNKLTDFNSNKFIDLDGPGWQIWVYNTLVLFARDLKNLFYIISAIFFLVICLKLIFSSNTDEELWKFKKWIIWITIGLIVMQIAFVFVEVVFDRWVSARLWVSIIDSIVYPLIELIRTLASIFFIAMAVYAFYRLVTANGNEEAVKSWKMSVLYALIWFLLVRFAQEIVEAFYGRVSCWGAWWSFVVVEWTECLNTSDLSQGANIIITVINYLNWFVAILVLLMIMYAGAQILLSGWDEEKISKWKKSLIYIALGLFVLAINFWIVTFFLAPDVAI